MQPVRRMKKKSCSPSFAASPTPPFSVTAMATSAVELSAVPSWQCKRGAGRQLALRCASFAGKHLTTLIHHRSDFPPLNLIGGRCSVGASPKRAYLREAKFNFARQRHGRNIVGKL